MSDHPKPKPSEVIFNKIHQDVVALEVGATEFQQVRDGLIFRVSTTRNGPTHVRVQLGRHEQYDIGYYRVALNDVPVKRIGMTEGIWFDQIVPALQHDMAVMSA